ncbi:MAG: DNA polymerase III subunit beta [Chloroflexi bacterium]|nr:DNA polymerase III subunit beta [Chloroflexota bacterium]
MRLSCLQENLSRGLGIVSSAVAARTTYPVMQNVLIATDNARLKLAATNQEIAISTWIGAQIEEEGEVTIPARLLTEFVNSLPAERIDLEFTEQPVGISVKCARFSAQINGTPASDFPPVPTVESGVAGQIDPRVLNDAIKHVAIAAATEDSRPVLTGIKVEISGDEFTLAAADGFRLAVYKGKLLEPLPEDVDFIIPARALREVSSLADGQTDPVEFTVTASNNQALFRLNNIEVVANLLQGTFPNYQQLVPDKHDTRASVNREEFIRATRAASIFAREGSNIVRLLMDGGEEEDGKLMVQSRSEEVGENKGEVAAEIEGGEAKIAFSSKYLTDVLNVLETGKVALETTTPSSPGVIKPVGDDNYVHVVMPIFVQW